MNRLISLTLLMFALAFNITREASGASIYNESTDGDLSNILNAPTALPILSIGSNEITGTVSPTDSNDVGSFVVPIGFQLDRVILSAYTSPLANSTSFALYPGAEVLFGSEIEFIHVAVFNVGTDLLKFDSAPGPQPAGIYTFRWGRELDDPATYTFNLQLAAATPVPEPSSLILISSVLRVCSVNQHVACTSRSARLN